MKAALRITLSCVLAATASLRAGEVRVEPALAVLPANHLKFYLHFRGPMERGEVFRHLRLVEVDGSGRETGEVPEPFREVELWDETFTRLTLWFHPGRQKPGVNLNVEIGPILEEGKRYRLEISGKWRDETGKPLGETGRFEFTAGAPDEAKPDPKRWTVTIDGRFVRVETGESLDPESLRKRVGMWRAGGKEAIATKVAADAGGFSIGTPESLPSGEYRLVIDPRLEDLAGNSVARPFNLDLGKAEEVKAGTVELPFTVP